MPPSISTVNSVTHHWILTVGGWSGDELKPQGGRFLAAGKPPGLTEPPQHIQDTPYKVGSQTGRLSDRFLRRGKRQIGIIESLHNILTSSVLNLFTIFLPISWVLYFRGDDWHLVFAFSFLAFMPLERLLDYCGDQMAFYCGKDLGDLIVITLNIIVEAILAITLLVRNEYRILQSTIIGVIVLHLLLIPGTAFITGGARIMSQDLSPHINELNHVLLTAGALSLVLPTAFFVALDRGANATIGGAVNGTTSTLLTDETRGQILFISRGMAVILLIIYICSRFYIHGPPGEDNVLQPRAELPAAIREHEEKLANEEPEVNQWVNIVVIVISVGFMAVTAQFLVESTEYVTHELHVPEVWLGLILLPAVCFAADGAIAIIYFFRSVYHHYFQTPIEPISLAKTRAIDLGVQFALFWMPVFVLIAWGIHKPFSLFFDLFEAAVLIGSIFLVNYVTADGKTNWAEGCAMVGFYTIIALTAWFYPGQPEVRLFLQPDSITNALAHGTLRTAVGEGH